MLVKLMKAGLSTFLLVGGFSLAAVSTTFAANSLPTIGSIVNQEVFVDQPVFDGVIPIKLILNDAETAVENLQLSLATSNPALVTPENVCFRLFITDNHWYLTLAPTFGLTGTATNTVTVSDGTNTASTSFVLTVKPPPPGAARFANTNVINIPVEGSASPYPSIINVTGMNGMITNMSLTLSRITHDIVSDVHMLLVGPTGQGMVIFAGIASGYSVTNTTVTLTDHSYFPLPPSFDLWAEHLRPADYAVTNQFPAPAPPGPYGPVAFSNSFNGLPANGTWSLYVYDNSGPNHGSVSGWSLMIATTDKRELTVTGITAADKVYDATTTAVINTNGITLVGVTNGDNVTLVPTGASGAFADQNAGNDKVVQITGLTLSGPDAGKYMLRQPTTTADITARAITVSAVAESRSYDGTTGSAGLPVVTAGSLASGDSGNFTQGFDTKHVGTNKVLTPAGSVSDGNGGNNYAITLQSVATGAITKAGATVSLGNLIQAYDGTAKIVTAVTVPASLPVALTYNGNPAAPTNAGSYSMVGMITDPNYQGAATNTLVISKAVLTVTADDKNRAYGAANPLLTAGYSGFRNGETLATSGASGSPDLSTTATNSSPAGDYPITAAIGSLSATNYSFVLVSGTLVIAVEQPAITSLSVAATTNVLIGWSALSGVTYRVQYRTDPNGGWVNLVPDVSATNNTASAIDNPNGATQRLYRIMIVP